MKFPRYFHFLCAVSMAWLPLRAQVADDSNAEPPPAGSTVITSDELHSDQNNHTSIFSGNVVAVGTNFKMTCQEMTVYFTDDNKVERILATGDVIITQPDRVTHCGHAEYFHDEDKFILTDQPVIFDHKNQISGPKIIIYRTTQKMTVEGRSNVILGPGSMGSSQTATSSTPTP